MNYRDLTAHNYDNIDFLHNKLEQEHNAGLIGDLEYTQSIDSIRRLVMEGRVEEFMEFAGYEQDIKL
jgi:hypothetical protein